MQLAHTNRVVTMGELSASITHEVNQPIAAARNNVIAALHFLDRNPPDLQEVREALAAAVKDADRVGAIVGRMRALMQKASPRLDRVDMNEALQEVIELTQGEALKNGVSVETQFAEGLPITTGDRVQLQQVVLNLILNALQAMGAVREGARQVLITTRQIELNDLYVGVQDTGPGLSPETLSRLFEPFYTTKPNGMGMGLAICRSNHRSPWRTPVGQRVPATWGSLSVCDPCSAVMINRLSVFDIASLHCAAKGPPQTPGSGTADQPLYLPAATR